ncbi:MAG: DUF3303 family protein [Pseudomonadota bacterium]
MTRYMVVEKFRPGALEEIYTRLKERGRGLPDGLFFTESWLSADGLTCFQVMETADPATFDAWMPFWSDLVSFEIVELGEKPEV